MKIKGWLTFHEWPYFKLQWEKWPNSTSTIHLIGLAIGRTGLNIKNNPYLFYYFTFTLFNVHFSLGIGFLWKNYDQWRQGIKEKEGFEHAYAR
jgi:hypothetical protein